MDAVRQEAYGATNGGSGNEVRTLHRSTCGQYRRATWKLPIDYRLYPLLRINVHRCERCDPDSRY